MKCPVCQSEIIKIYSISSGDYCSRAHAERDPPEVWRCSPDFAL